MSGLILPYKIGDCEVCGEKNTECKKRQKRMLCLMCAKKEDVEKQTKRANLKRKMHKVFRDSVANGDYEQASRQALKNDLDFVVSRIVRLSAADANGMVKCYTCPTVKHWSLIQAGHFISRQESEFRWDYNRNIRPQCPPCNSKTGLQGNLEVFAANLEAEQAGLPEMLKERSREPYKWTTDEMKQLLSDLRPRLRVLEAKFNTKKPS